MLSEKEFKEKYNTTFIQIHKESYLDEVSEEDKEIGLIYQTQYGDCSLYRDIFGRYYCRW